MKKTLLLVLLIISSLISCAQLTPKSVHSANGDIGFYEFRPPGYNADSSYNYPLLIFLHGIGERGNGTTELSNTLNSSFAKMLPRGATMQFTVNGRKHAFLVLIPQMSKKYINWQNFYIDEMIGFARKHLKVDTNRIFLSGWSLGGGGAWKYATFSVENASKLAGIIPVAPAPDYTALCNLARGNVAVWAHHAKDDASVPLHYTEDAITGLNACLPRIPGLITYYPKGGHPYVADIAYDTLNCIQYPNMFQWMIGTSRTNTLASNKPPIADAGNDTVIVLPARTAALNGSLSVDRNDVIVHYSWALVKGPHSPEINIRKPDFPVTEVSGLEPGDYTFRLTVTDEFNTRRSADINIKVVLPKAGINATPIVNSGAGVTTGDDYYRLHGEGRDFDGSIKMYQWRQVSGPVSISIHGKGKSVNLWGLTRVGNYSFELTVWDNHVPAGIAKDTLMVTRVAQVPVYFTLLSKDNLPNHKEGIIWYNIMAAFLLMCTFEVPVLNHIVFKKMFKVLVVYCINSLGEDDFAS